MKLAEMREAAAEMERILRLQTYPIAIKVVRDEREIPVEAKRPVRMGSVPITEAAA